MLTLPTMIVLAGVCQFGILVASFSAPRLLDWKHTLAPLTKLNRQLIWTHGIYVAGTIAAFGLVSVAAPHMLADGSPLARIVCGFIAAFWGGRLFLQWFVFDPREHITTPWLRFGYHALTVVFVVVTAIYTLAAIPGTH